MNIRRLLLPVALCTAVSAHAQPAVDLSAAIAGTPLIWWLAPLGALTAPPAAYHFYRTMIKAWTFFGHTPFFKRPFWRNPQ